MKKTTKRMWTVLGIVVVLIMAALGGAILKAILETRNMSPSATQEIINNVYAVKDGYVNLFLIKGTEGYIAIDAGNNLKGVRQEMQKLSIDPLKVAAVFLTHTDADHVAALDLFSNAKIYISRAEEQMINGKTPRFVVMKNKKIAHYELLDHDQTITVSGLSVRGVATPGHTPGAMSYVINDAWLFVGDTLSLKNGRADLFNEFFNMDSDTEKESIKKLAGLKNIQYIFTAHYGYTDDTGHALGHP